MDNGREAVLIAFAQADPSNVIAGASIHNTRAESVWSSLLTKVSREWTKRLAELHALGWTPSDPLHRAVMMRLLLPLLQADLDWFKDDWNGTGKPSNGNRKPKEVFTDAAKLYALAPERDNSARLSAEEHIRVYNLWTEIRNSKLVATYKADSPNEEIYFELPPREASIHVSGKPTDAVPIEPWTLEDLRKIFATTTLRQGDAMTKVYNEFCGIELQFRKQLSQMK
jgi:hypothetical protein